jgi:hypothetical protein
VLLYGDVLLFHGFYADAAAFPLFLADIWRTNGLLQLLPAIKQ